MPGLGNRTTALYDAYGRYEATLNPLGYRATTVYDSYGRLSATVDELGNRTTTVYDSVGRVSALVDALANRATFAYDSLNRLVTQTDPLNKSATFAYDAVGRLSSTTDRLGRRRDFGYDDAGQLLTESWIPTGGGAATSINTMTYDAAGNELTAKNGNGTYTLTYDALHRVTKVEEPYALLLTFTYNAVSLRTKVEDNFGGVATSTYDALGRLTKREFGGASQTALRIDLTYTADHQLDTATRYLDLAGTTKVATTSMVYDSAGRLTNLIQRKGDTTNLGYYTFVYDNHSRLTSETLDGTTRTFVYDNSNQMTADGTNTFTYDSEGNRNNGGYTTGTGNRLTSDGTWTYSYDDEGNMTKKTLGASAETWTYGYDHLNHLTWVEKRATDGGTLQLRSEYKYDVWGNRLEKKVDTNGDGGFETTERYGYDGWKTGPSPSPLMGEGCGGGGFMGPENFDVWSDLDGSNSLTTRYLRGDVVDEIFARTDSGTAYWYLTDRLGSIRDVIANTSSATVKDHLNYDGFGNISSETDANFRGRYAWTGREIDTESGFQYNRSRYYDPRIGRWTSQDPIGFDAGDSNLYRYVVNQYVNLTDPSGFDSMGGLPSGAPITAGGLISKTPALDTRWHFVNKGEDLADLTGISDEEALESGPEGTDEMVQKLRESGASEEQITRYLLMWGRANAWMEKWVEIWMEQWGDGPGTRLDVLNIFRGIAYGGTGGLSEKLQAGLGTQPTPWGDPSFNGGAFIGSFLPAGKILGGLQRIGNGLDALQNIAQGNGGLGDALALAPWRLPPGLKNIKKVPPVRVKRPAVPIAKPPGAPILQPGNKGKNAFNPARPGPIHDKPSPPPASANAKGPAKKTGPSDSASQAQPSKSNCFPPETLVATETGLQPIWSVRVGDKVWAFDFHPGEWRLSDVEARHDTYHDGIIVSVDVGIGEVRATKFHAFWVVEGEDLEARPQIGEVDLSEDAGGALPGRWVSACDLRAGDVVYLRERGQVTVKRVSQAEVRTPVCSLTVHDLHTFAVGEAQVLVHNLPDSTGNNGNGNGNGNGVNANQPTGVKLTGKGKDRLGNLADLKDKPLGQAIRDAGGGQGQVRHLDNPPGGRDISTMLVGEVANAAGRGDRWAIAAIKMLKQAGSQGKGGK